MVWWMAAVVAIGLVLAVFYLLERRPPAVMRAAAVFHGLAGAAGVVVLLGWLWGGAADPRGFGRFATGMLVCALALGAMAALARGRPGGLVVMLHATFGAAGLVLLAAW